MKKYIIYLVLFGVAGTGFGFYMYNKPHQNMASAKADLQISANDLFTDFEADEAVANSKFLDKIIDISGTVRSVSKEGETISVTLDSGDDMAGIICQLDNLTQHKRTTFEPGENVRFKGICSGMLMDVVLIRCVEN